MSRTPPTPAEVAAITAAITAVQAEQVAQEAPASEQLAMWVEASRRSAQRALLQRGPWRLSGRLGRRSRT